MYEYATMFCTSVEEAVKRVSKWAAAYYTHPNSYYKLPTSHVVSLPHIKIPKPTSQKITRNEEAEMRAWGKMHGQSVRQRNVRQDNTMDRAGTLPLNLYETETVLKPVNLNSLIGVERVPSESDEPPNSNEDASLPPDETSAAKFTAAFRSNDILSLLHLFESTKFDLSSPDVENATNQITHGSQRTNLKESQLLRNGSIMILKL